jgi:uncharacterized membrane protein YidH (DUF202 family)
VPEDVEDKDSVNLAIDQLKLIMAEKRTSLAFLRTGIAVFALPLSVLGVLIATSELYDYMRVMHLLVPLLIICAGLVGLGIYLVSRAVRRVRSFEHRMNKIKAKHQELSDLLG